MIRSSFKTGLMAVVVLAGLLPAAHAATLASLNDWCFNINGSTSFCNTGQSTVTFPSGVNGSNFDFTLGSQTEGTPSTPFSGFPTTVNDQNTLGSIQITLFAGANQYVLAYMDYDLNYNASGVGSFSDSASIHGAQPFTTAYSLNDPNACAASCPQVSDIVDQVFANTLDNTNHVGTYQADGVCCDVSWALGKNLTVANGTKDIITFTVSKTAPIGGFYLQQTNGLDSSQNIYFQATLAVQNVGNGTPEPASWFLIGGGLAGAFLLRKRTMKAQTKLA